MQIKNSRVLQLHAALQTLGVFAQAHYLAKFLTQKWEATHHIYGLVSWAAQPRPPKIEIMLEYGLLLSMAAIIILAVFTYTSRNRQCVEINSLRWTIFAAYELACLGFAFSPFWILLSALLPIWLYSRHASALTSRVERRILAIVFSLIAGTLLLQLVTALSQGVHIPNHYSDLTEYTRMEDGRLVENSVYERRHLFNRYLDVDLCENAPKDFMTERCLKLSNKVFRNAEESFAMFPPESGVSYDWEKETLAIRRSPTTKQQLLIESLWGAKIGAFRTTIEPSRTHDEEEFAQKNIVATNDPKFMGSYLDNQSRLYLPSLAASAQNSNEILALYGTGLTIVLASLLKMSGSMTFNEYLFLSWGATFTYILMLGYAIWILTRSPWVVAIVLLLVELVVPNDVLTVDPELNPILHFPDLMVLIAIAYDAQKGSVRSAMIRALGIGLAIWWSREFGLALLVASVIWNLLIASSEKEGWRTAAVRLAMETVVAILVIVGTSWAIVSHQTDPRQFVASNVLGNWRLLVFIIALIGMHIWARFSIRSSSTREARKILDAAGVGAIYLALVAFFVLPENYLVIGPLILFLSAVPVSVLVTWAANRHSAIRDETPRFLSYITYALFIVCVGSFLASYVTHRQTQHDNEDHANFKWEFPGLSASSRIDPKEMQESLGLISKYQPVGRLQIISKYESWFRVLSMRPEHYVYLDWRSAVSSHEMASEAAARIVQSNAPVVFVERRLLASIGGNVRSDTTESLLAMKLLVKKIAQCYKPGEVGGLLQAWHRSCEEN